MNQEYLNLLEVPRPLDLPFSNIFGDKYLISIPLYNSKIEEMIELLSSGSGSSGTSWKVDIENQRAWKTVETDRGTKNVYSRLGKVIFKELGKEWADEWARQSDSISEGDYVIILSRHPYDVLRMSDHREWTSCHSSPEKYDGANYFHCAVEEAKTGGPIAYVVRNQDYKEIEDDLQNEEIFEDDDRRINGIRPLSRMRVNRYINTEDNYELALPTTRTYGKSISGFDKTLKRFLLSIQDKEIGDADFEMEDFGRYGGSYYDYTDENIFNSFFNTDRFSGETEYLGNEEEEIESLWGRELDQANSLANKLKYTFLSVDMENLPRLSINHSIQFIYPNIIDENIPYRENNYGNYIYINKSPYNTNSEIINLQKQLDYIKNKKSQGMELDEKDSHDLEEYPKQIAKLQIELSEIEKLNNLNESIREAIGAGSIFYCDEVDFEKTDDKLQIRCHIDVSEIDNPDDFSSRVNEAQDFEETEYDVIYAEIYKKLLENKLIEQSVVDKSLSNYQFQNLNFQWNPKTGNYEININLSIIEVPKQYISQISNDIYNEVFNYALKMYQEEMRQQWLIPIEFGEMNRENLPEPVVKIENAIKKSKVPDPHYKDSADSWRYTIIQEEPTGYADLNISFNLPIYSLNEYNNQVLLSFLSILDKNYENIKIYLDKKIKDIVAKYQNMSSTSNINNWYKIIRESKK